MEFEGSGSSSGAEKRISHGRNNCPAGLKNRGKRKVWAPRALPQTLGDLCPLPGPSSRTLLAWLLGPHRSPSNLQPEPIGPNRTVWSVLMAGVEADVTVAGLQC